MKYTFRSILVWVLLAATGGCSLLTGEKEPDYYWAHLGEITAVANGELWEGKPFGIHRKDSSHMTLYGDVFDIPGDHAFAGRRLRLLNVPTEPGRVSQYKFGLPNPPSKDRPPRIYYSTKFESDVGGDMYYLVEESDNWVEVERYDKATGWIEGSFQLTVALNPDRQKFMPMNPDTIHFTNGRFRTHVWDSDEWEDRNRKFFCRYYGWCP